jgi:hypothetical protein
MLQPIATVLDAFTSAFNRNDLDPRLQRDLGVAL